MIEPAPAPAPNNYRDLLSAVPIFSALSEDEVSWLASHLVTTRYQFGQTVVSQGSYCEGLYVIFSGSVRLFVQENGKDISMGLRKSGDIFAEVNVLRNSPLEFTARATAGCEILKIPRVALTDLWEQNPKIEEYMTRYAAVKATGGLVASLFDLKGEIGKKEFEAMIETIGIKKVDSGQVVLRQDSFEDRRLYVIRQGRVRVVRQEGDREYQIAVLGKGETFGERALLFSDHQPATVMTQTNSTFLVIPDSTVKTILEHHPGLKTSFEERITSFEQELERKRKLASQKLGRWHFSPVEGAGIGARILDRFPLVEQEEEMDCGAACLAMLCRYHGIQTTLEQLRDLADIDRRGTTLESLAVASERLGFIARGVSASFSELIEFELPLLVHWQGYHYIVVYGVSGQQIHVADPALGFRKMTPTEFEKGWDGTCLLLERDDRRSKVIDTGQPKIGPDDLFKPVRPWISAWLAMALFSGVLAVVPPFLIMVILDGGKITGGSATPGFLVLGFLFVSGFICLANLLRGLFAGFLKHRIIRQATSNFIQQILYQPLEFFERRKASDLMARFRDNDKFWIFFAEQGVELLAAFWTVALSWLALFFFDAGMAGIYIAIHLIVIAILRFAATRSHRVVTNHSGDAPAVLRDVLEGVETIKAQGAEFWMRCRWESATVVRNESKWKKFQYTSYVKFGTWIIQTVALTFLVWQGIALYSEQGLTAGEFMAAFLLAAGSFPALGNLVGGWLEWLAVQPGLQRVQSINRLAPEQSTEQAAQNIILPELKGRFMIENLYFRYQKHSPYVIEGLGLEIEARQWVSFIGPSGTGKTTLAKLLMGFYSIHEGRIDVDGYPVNLLEKGSYRRQIGYLPQNPFLIRGTLLDNIALGIRAPQRKRIIDVCRLVGLNDLINQLPAGYDCPVSELDELDSNDWMVRLGVARALSRGPSVLILDQALSRLELQVESDILNQIRETYPAITMITFSERVNLYLEPDRVFLLYNGRIAESGSSQDLRARNGLYGELLSASDFDR
ncbi:MAG: peptidase domain-containing ABC transporter [Methylococcales bacterium]